MENLIHADGVEIHVDDAAAEGFVLDLLDQRHAAGLRAGVLDFEFDEDVLAAGAGKEVIDVASAHLEGQGRFLAPVNDRGHEPFAFEFICHGTPDSGAGANGEFNLFCHNSKGACLRLLFSSYWGR
jgi:hypothetical protein